MAVCWLLARTCSLLRSSLPEDRSASIPDRSTAIGTPLRAVGRFPPEPALAKSVFAQATLDWMHRLHSGSAVRVKWPAIRSANERLFLTSPCPDSVPR